MKYANRVVLKVFSNPEDDETAIRTGLLFLSSYTKEELESEKIKIDEIRAKGFNEKTIKILTLELIKDRHCNHFLKFLNENLTNEQRQLLIDQTDRIDDNIDFFIRFEKESLFKKEFNITESGDCFHVRISLAAFPKNKMSAHKLIKEIFSLKN